MSLSDGQGNGLVPKSDKVCGARFWIRLRQLRCRVSSSFLAIVSHMNFVRFVPEKTAVAVDPYDCAMVQTPRFRCLAFKNGDGAWIDAYHPNGPALNVIRVEELLRD